MQWWEAAAAIKQSKAWPWPRAKVLSHSCNGLSGLKEMCAVQPVSACVHTGSWAVKYTSQVDNQPGFAKK